MVVDVSVGVVVGVAWKGEGVQGWLSGPCTYAHILSAAPSQHLWSLATVHPASQRNT